MNVLKLNWLGLYLFHYSTNCSHPTTHLKCNIYYVWGFSQLEANRLFLLLHLLHLCIIIAIFQTLPTAISDRFSQTAIHVCEKTCEMKILWNFNWNPFPFSVLFTNCLSVGLELPCTSCCSRDCCVSSINMALSQKEAVQYDWHYRQSSTDVNTCGFHV